MLADLNFDVQITGWPAVAPGFPFTPEADAIAVVDAGRNLDRQRFRATSPTLAMAVIAGLLNDLPATFAARTGLLNAEKSLADAHAPLPVAGFAGDRARAFCRSAAAANLALSERLEVDIDAIAEDS